MLRGYRFIVIAAFGWLSLAASNPPNQSSHPDKAASQNEISDAANTVATAITETVKSPEKDGGCDQGKDERNSDLCAQWKAADAARDAANYAFWSLFGTIVGTVLLIWTLSETRLSSRREARAYVKFEMIQDSIAIDASEMFAIPLRIVNYGLTPAINVEFQSAICLNAPDWKWSGDIVTKPNGHASVVLQKDTPLTVEISSGHSLSAAQIRDIEQARAVIYARATVFYCDVFKRQHCTQISLEIRSIELAKKAVRAAPTGNIAT
jgi:hypothetical protein